MSRVLRAADEHCPDHADSIYLLAWTGLRISEACGLRWGIWTSCALRLGQPSRRLPAASLDRRCAQVREVSPRGLARGARGPFAGSPERQRGGGGSGWPRALTVVFPAPSDDTKPMNAAFLRFKVWYRLLRRAEVRSIRIHDLRHTYASLLLLAGEPMLYVKEQLGHSTVQVTVDFYGHIRPGLNRGAVNRLAEATRPGAPAVELHSDYTSERR